MPRRRTNTIRKKERVYSRSNDCWNCGLPFHVSKDCTAPRVLRCSFCRRPGVKSDRCDCRRRRQAPVKRLGQGQVNRVNRSPRQYESVILISICGKHIKAVINPGVQTSRIGKGVVSLIEQFEKINPKRTIFKSNVGLELANTIIVEAGIRERQLYPIECIIDHRLPKNDMVLGMKAMVTFGYRITVAGREAMQREIEVGNRRVSPPRPRRRSSTENPPSTSRRVRGGEQNETRAHSSDDDRMSFLDEEEATRIREWRY